VCFARDDGRIRAFEDEIDDASDRSVNSHLRRWTPHRVQRAQERADHRRLDVIAHDRPCAGVDTEGQRSAQRGGEPSEHLM
jgi:hypothetical protein